MVIVTKTCKGPCGEEKPLEYFSQDLRNKSGRGSLCKKCNNLRTGNWFKKNKEKARAYSISYRLKNPDKVREATATWVKNNPEKSKTSAANYRANNPEKTKQASAGWRARNIEKAREASIAWMKNNPEKMKAHAEKRKAKIKQATPFWLTQEEKSAMFDMWRNKPVGFVVDHIVPIQGKDFSGLNVPWNLRYLDRIENIRKKNKLPEKELQIGSRY